MTRRSLTDARALVRAARMGATVSSISLACLLSAAPVLATEPPVTSGDPAAPAQNPAETPGAPAPAGADGADGAARPDGQVGGEQGGPAADTPEGAPSNPGNGGGDLDPADPAGGNGESGPGADDPNGGGPGPSSPNGGAPDPDDPNGDPGTDDPNGGGPDPNTPTGGNPDSSDPDGGTPDPNDPNGENGPAANGGGPKLENPDGGDFDPQDPSDPDSGKDPAPEPDGANGPDGSNAPGPADPASGAEPVPDDPGAGVDVVAPEPVPNAANATLASDGSTLLFVARGDDFARAWGVAFEVKGPQGTKWHAATRQDDGSWALSLPASVAGSSTVTAGAWANIGSSPSQKLATATYEAPRPKADISLEWDDAAGTIVVRATNASCPSGIEFISVGLTPPAGHAKWYKLALQDDGSWAANVDPEVFKWQPGAYAAELVICDKAWVGIPLGACRADLNFGTESISGELDAAGVELTLGARGGRLGPAWGVAFEIKGSSKTSWVACERTEDRGWSVTIDPAKWGGGVITATLYANVGSTNVCMGSTQVRTDSSTPQVTCNMQAERSTVVLSVAGGAVKKATNVAFSVYNATSGLPTVWHQAHLQEDGSWQAEIPADSHGVGTCAVKAYATVDGSTSKVASSQYTYKVVPVLVDSVELGGGDYDVSYGMSGLKVLRIHQALGIGDPNYPRYQDYTVSVVRSFQARVGLPVTGVVDFDTWVALGLTPHEWFNLGAYASPVQVGENASAAERVEAMIDRAYDYLGDRYVWDASGAPGQGIDCSGLVMQALYAAGVDTGIINPVTHATTAWGDASASAFYHYGGFNKVSYNDRKRGDLIYYGVGGINHIAIYLGNNQIIEAYPHNVRISSVWSPGTVYGVTRVFN